MTQLIPPTSGANLPEWIRKAATAINALISRGVQRDGVSIYTAPTISALPTQAEVQAIADALAAVSARLE